MENQGYNKTYIEELAHKWKEGTLTSEEQKYFDTWYDKQMNSPVEVNGDFARDRDALRNRMHNRLRESVRSANRPAQEIFRLWPKLLGAASIVLFLGIGLLFYWPLHQKLPVRVFAARPQIIPPGTNKATLTLSNGTRIALNNSGSKVLGKQGNTSIQTSNGQLIYLLTHNSGAAAVAIVNTIATPQGGQYQLILPDGTHVWLNAASSLQYPALFTGNTRTVTLTGEAYFEVSHNPNMPFIVKSAGQEIKVLGTHFNVNAYTDELATVTTLLQGSVKLSSTKGSALLRPGQQSLASASGFTVSSGDVRMATAWKDGAIFFRKTDIRKALREISRWYNIDVEYKGRQPDFTISGEVSRQADLSAVLKMLKLLDIRFELQGRKLIISN